MFCTGFMFNVFLHVHSWWSSTLWRRIHTRLLSWLHEEALSGLTIWERLVVLPSLLVVVGLQPGISIISSSNGGIKTSLPLRAFLDIATLNICQEENCRLKYHNQHKRKNDMMRLFYQWWKDSGQIFDCTQLHYFGKTQASWVCRRGEAWTFWWDSPSALRR